MSDDIEKKLLGSVGWESRKKMANRDFSWIFPLFFQGKISTHLKFQ
jgi:hypothetical protein